MRVRDLMLASLGGGLVVGSVLGMTTNTTMKPAPEPEWRQAAHDDGGSSPATPAVEQPDINSAWSAEHRTPTWKRHLPKYQTADYAVPTYSDYAPPEPEVANQAPAEPAPRADAADVGRPADDAAAPTEQPGAITLVPAETARAGA